MYIKAVMNVMSEQVYKQWRYRENNLMASDIVMVDHGNFVYSIPSPPSHTTLLNEYCSEEAAKYYGNKTYVTFGQVHTHSINGKTFDKDCVAVIDCESEEEGRELAFEIFNGVFCFSYYGKQFNFSDLKHFPRGLIYVG